MTRDHDRPIPPALAVRLLGRTLGESEREGILGDLEEVFVERARIVSPIAARRWYWAEALRLSIAFSRERRAERRPRRAMGRRGGGVGGWAADLRLALRLARKNLWLTSVAVCALGAAMALSIVGFSVVWPQYAAPLPFDQPTRIVAVRDIDRRSADDAPTPVGVLREWQRRQASFESFAAYTSARWEIEDDEGGSRRFRVASVTSSAFDVARVPPLLGRVLEPEDEAPGAPPVLVVGQRAWRVLLGADPDVVGRTLEVDGTVRVVVGVMPERYRWPISEDLWIPLDLAHAAIDEQPAGLRVFGRLAAGVGAEQAAAELDAIRQAVVVEQPALTEVEERSTFVVPYVRGATEPGMEKVYLLMFVFFVLVLLVACASVSNLLLARASARTGEIAVRSALGASRARLVAQLFVEALVLACGGAAVGLVVAHAGLTWFDGFVQIDMRPFWIEFEVNVAAVVFAAVAAFFAAAAAGLAPALKATGLGGSELLKDEHARSSSLRFGRLSGTLTVLEVTLSVAFLAGAALAAKSFVETSRADVAYPAESVLTASLRMSDQIGYRQRNGVYEIVVPENAIARDQWPAYQEQIRRSAAELSGALGAALATRLPGDQHQRERIEVEAGHLAAGDATPRVFSSAITPELFEILDAGLIAGRNFDGRDRASSERVAIVNQSFVRDVLGGGEAVGRRLRRVGGDAEAAWLRIVGVAPDLGMNPGNRERQAGYYTPLYQGDHNAVQLAVRSAGEPLLLSRPLREIVRAIDPRLDVGDLATLSEVGAQYLVVYQMMSMIFVGVGFMALLLAVAGLYAVMSLSVTQRTREIGLRVALGASPLGVLRVVLGRGLRQVGLGLLLGSIAGTFVLRLLRAFPIDFASGGPGLLAAVALILLAAGVAACAIPASRGLRLRPVEALRHE
jgi:predicted permease